MTSTDILTALQWRYATKVFDPAKKLSAEDLHTILESGRLAPSSFGIEPWKFLLIETPELRTQLRAVGFDQPKITDAAHLIVIARRTDVRAAIAGELIARTAATQGKAPEELAELRGMVEGSIASKSDEELDAWVRGQVYIPLGIMIETAALLGIDSGPMEGFDPAGVDRILDLPAQHLRSTTMFALGYRGEDDFATLPKTRRAFDEVVERR